MDPIVKKNKKIFRAVRIILSVIFFLIAIDGIFMFARSVVNTAFLRNYEKGSYSEMPERFFLHLKFGENYVVPYNLGNVAYQYEDYDKAVTYYRQALSSGPPELEAECKVRVNLALSMCHTIDFDKLDTSDEKAVSKAVSTLQKARLVLTDHGCASEPVGSDDGHFRDADQLKHDIDDMLNKLQNPPESDQNQDQKDQQDQNQDQKDQQDQNQDQKKDQSDSKDSRQDQSTEEQSRQQELKEQLQQQKQDLRNGSDSSENNGFHYIEGGESKGYGDGTLW
jgi:tetratricopeptide (TPR) repeat protein